MDSLPFEVIHIISLKLLPLSLAVCREYYSIYEDQWYRSYLEKNHKGINLWRQITWKELWKRSQIEGSIFIDERGGFNNFIGNGVKTSECYNMAFGRVEYLILNFNGDLYLNDKLIMSQVIDITTNYFITSDTCYHFEMDKIIKDTIIPKSSFIKIIENYYTVYILTSDTLYIDSDDNIIEIPFENAIDMYSSRRPTILQANGDLYYIADNEKILHRENAVSLKGNSIILSTGEIIVNLNTNGYLPIPASYTTLIEYCNKYFILNNQILHIYSHDDNNHDQITDVKSIGVTRRNMYIIQ